MGKKVNMRCMLFYIAASGLFHILMQINTFCSHLFPEGTIQEQNAISPTAVVHRDKARIAIVMRAVDPVGECILRRFLSMSDVIQTRESFQNYDFFVLLDQTKGNTTNASTIRLFFAKHNASDLRVPSIFRVSEGRIRGEFPKLSLGYMTEPLLDGSHVASSSRPLMWQLLSPAIAVFSRYNQEYDYTWVFEDDVWSLGQPLIEMFRRWDVKMEDSASTTDLAVFRNMRSGIPYSPKMQERHTEGFNEILTAMKATRRQRKHWKTLLAKDGQQWSPVWTKWNTSLVPRWNCVSDAFYRHSRAFSAYLYDSLANNIYQFAECYQHPLAWWGDFNVTDLQTLLDREERVSITWEHNLVNKITRREAIRRFRRNKDTIVSLYHGVSAHRIRNWSSVPANAICSDDRYGLS